MDVLEGAGDDLVELPKPLLDSFTLKKLLMTGQKELQNMYTKVYQKHLSVV